MKTILWLAYCFLLLPAPLWAQSGDVVRSVSLEEVISRPRWLSLPHSRLVVNPTPPGATLVSGITDPVLTTNLAYYVGESPVMLPGIFSWQAVSSSAAAPDASAGLRLDFARDESPHWTNFGLDTQFEGPQLRMTATGNYGSITRDVTVDLDQTPRLAIHVLGGEGDWAVKVRAEGEADIPLIASDTHQSGIFTADIPALTGWRGKRAFKLVLFAVGRGRTVFVKEVRFLNLPGRVSSSKTTWYPHQIRMEASLPSPARTVESMITLPDTNTVAQRLRVRSGGKTTFRLMGDFLKGRITWDARHELLHLQATRFNVTLAFSRPAHWRGIRASGIDWLSPGGAKPGGAKNAVLRVWALDFDSLAPGEEVIVIARFSPTVFVQAEDSVAAKRLAKSAVFSHSLRQQEAAWDRWLAAVPRPLDFTLRTVDAKGVTAETVHRTYYRAWVFLLAGTLPPMPENSFRYPQFPTGKPSLWDEGAPPARASAQWESFVAMQALSLVMPYTAWDAYEGIMTLVQKDGSLNGEGLPSCHAQTAWVLYSLTGDSTRLRRVYPALKRLLLWKAANPRWIYKNSTPPGQKDQQFVLYVLQDMEYARRIACVLEMPKEMQFWAAQRATVTRNFHRWFWETPGGIPYRIYGTTTGKRSGGNSSWNLTALELPLSVLTVPGRNSLLDSFRAQFQPDLPFLIPGLSRWADYIGTERGLFQYGHLTEAAMMADAGMRDVALAGEFSETYRQETSPPTPDGVRPSVFGTRFAIDGAFWHNGVVFDEGLLVLIGVTGARGVTGLHIRGKILDVRFATDGQVLLQGAALAILRCPTGFVASRSVAGESQWKGVLLPGERIFLEEKAPMGRNRKGIPAQR